MSGVTPTYLTPLTRLFAIAGAIIGVVGVFMLPPPGDNTALPFSRFLIAVLVGLMLIPATLWSSRSVLRYWVGVTIVLLLGGIVVFAVYARELDQYTSPYGHGRLIIGTHMLGSAITDKTRLEMQEQHPISTEQFIEESGGMIATIWPEDEIRTNAERLEAEYILGMVIFGALMVSLLQAIALAQVNIPK